MRHCHCLCRDYNAGARIHSTIDVTHRRLTRYATCMDREEVMRVLRAFESAGLDGTQVRVATPAALYRMKKGTVRSQDHVDAAALRERFGLKDEG